MSPGSEGVANAIDDQPTKYLNFDIVNTGFTVTPKVGLSVVQCLTLTSANDAPERDPSSYLLEGSYDGVNFILIASGNVPLFTNRFEKIVLPFDPPNNTPYLIYRVTFPTVVNAPTAANSMQISEVELLGFLAPTDVTQPGDPIVASSTMSPGSEGVANAIDNQPTKYLNFDIVNTGFTVTPSVGATLVTGLTLTSANDAPERDPSSYLLEGSLDGISFFEIASNSVPPFPARFDKQYFFFANSRAYKAYRLTFPTVVNAPTAANSMQISEVEFLGAVADLPQDITQPGDPIVASSTMSPGSEGVANAIDDQPTKYLNFDILNTGFTVSPVAGLTLVSGITLTSANDAPERDPSSFTLEGAYDGTNFTLIASNSVPLFTNRFEKITLLFDNSIPYLQYRVIFPTVVNAPTAANSMQISEVELLGVLAPTDVTVPGDPIVASSTMSPGSEGVANAIDDQPTKYLNFDILNTGFTVTPNVGDTIVSGLVLTSANDAPERDPSSYKLDGSNDGSNYVSISSGPVATFPARFYNNYIFFTNTKSFKSYRLIFPTVVNAPTAANSMQISEVQFLGVTPGVVNTNPVTTLIRKQPQDTPVLLGSQATFICTLSGPWKIQWFRDGVKIPGANNANYTTAPAVAGDDGAHFQALVQSPQGQQLSDKVILSIFTPSATESIAVSFEGSSANGAPTAMLFDDITGFWPQAYWNNVTGGGGTLATPMAPIDSSSNTVDAITISWATSGTWGVGTGNQDPLERMLNGMDTSTSTARYAADGITLTAQTVTFMGVPAPAGAGHSLLLYTVQVPLEFFNMDFFVVTHDAMGADVVQQRFIRPQNADEYNPSPGFILATASTPQTRSVGNMLRFDNLQPLDGFIQIQFYSPGRVQTGGQPIRGPGLNGFQLLLDPPPVGTPPEITQQPVSANGVVGGQVTLTVVASGPSLTYQWLKNGQRISGATNPQLRLLNLSSNDVAHYTVAISNPAGTIRSENAVVDVRATDQITEGLIAYFPFDDDPATSTTVSNAVAGGQSGVIEGSSPFSFVGGRIGGALLLNGSDNDVFVPDYAKPSAAVTLAGWVESDGNLVGPIINNWVQAGGIGTHGQFFIDIVPDSDGINLDLDAHIAVGPNEPIARGPIGPNDGSLLFNFHHVAMSANGAVLSIYWDGVLVTSADYLGSINTPTATTPLYPWLSLGGNISGDNPPLLLTPFAGELDDFAMWGRSLSGVEINAIYQAGLNNKSVAQVPPVLIVSPRLSITKTAGGIHLSWGQNFVGFGLQSSPKLPATTWTPVPGVVNNSVVIANPSSPTFFRLVQP